MCLVFLSLKAHPTYKLIIATNRDEFYNRKTQPADFWSDHPDILGGRDLEAGGTWLGITKTGKISLITNYRDPKNINPKAPSRGHLVSDYLSDNIDAETFLKKLEPAAKKYNGFNLLTGTVDDLLYFSNYGKGVERLNAGQYGLSNHLLDTPWPKVQRIKSIIGNLVKRDFTTSELFQALYNNEVAEDTLLPDTGLSRDFERALSSMFIKTQGYGTRSSTVVLVDHQDNLFFAERVYDLTTFDFSERAFNFKIES